MSRRGRRRQPGKPTPVSQPHHTSVIDVSNSDVHTGPMSSKTKRTYNLPVETVNQVRELVGQYGTSSQDAVVELAVERLFREARDLDEAARWAAAAGDPEFQDEMRAIASDFGDATTWPR